MKEIEKAEAFWHDELTVECPYCEEYQKIDYQDIDEWWTGFEVCSKKENIDYKHTCEECGRDFIVDSTCW